MKTVSPAVVMDRLGIDKESFRALGLLPLVHVAWADGKVQMGETSVQPAQGKPLGKPANQPGHPGDRIVPAGAA